MYTGRVYTAYGCRRGGMPGRCTASPWCRRAISETGGGPTGLSELSWPRYAWREGEEERGTSLGLVMPFRGEEGGPWASGWASRPRYAGGEREKREEGHGPRRSSLGLVASLEGLWVSEELSRPRYDGKKEERKRAHGPREA